MLSQLGIEHLVRPADIDETPRPGEPAIAYVRRMAASKAHAGSLLASDLDNDSSNDSTGAAVLAADTIVIADGLILGKPRDEADGLGMLARLSGRTHLVATAVCLRQDVRQSATCSVTRVSFRSVGVQEARRYWASGEPQDKAGGYGIQGAAAAFVRKLEGSYSGVIGLPLSETLSLLRTLGR